LIHFYKRLRQKKNRAVHCLGSTNTGNNKNRRNLKEAQYLFNNFV